MQNMLAFPGIITELSNESLCQSSALYIYFFHLRNTFLLLLLKERKKEKDQF